MTYHFSQQYKFEFEFSQLGITHGHIERMMGFEGKSPDPFPQYIDQVLEQAVAMKGIRGSLYLYKDIVIDAAVGTIRFGETIFNTGKIIASHLKKCIGMALFVCTAGDTLAKFAQNHNNQGNLPEAYIADVTGSLIVEAAMDQIQEKFWGIALESSHGITNRYSPGYCGWNVAEQQKLFRLLPPYPCQISLSSSSLMQPIKSVSGIIGFGPGVKSKGYTCQFCEMADCIYRNKRIEV